MKKNIEVFLGGTCEGYDWRKYIIPQLKCDYFDPVVEDWTEECRLKEIEKRKTCDYVLYVITSGMRGYYSIAEVTDDSNKRPEKTVLCVLKTGFDKKQIKSFEALEKMIESNGATVLHSEGEIVDFFNSKVR